MLGHYVGYRVEIVDHPCLVVGRHHRDEANPVHAGQGRRQGVEVDPTAGIGGNHHSASFPYRSQYRRMLHGRANRQAACRPNHAVNGEVVSLGPPAGEHHLTGCRSH